MASQWLGDGPVQSYLGDTVRLQYVLNPGGFLSLGSSLPPSVRSWLFVGFNSTVILGMVGLLIFRWNARPVQFISLAYVLAGGIGNMMDRMTQDGLVTDFLNVGIGPIRTGIFNVADVALCFGAIALVICSRDRRP
jgi:signal peptidase II